jgi:hypothetical protein
MYNQHSKSMLLRQNLPFFLDLLPKGYITLGPKIVSLLPTKFLRLPYCLYCLQGIKCLAVAYLSCKLFASWFEI